MFFTWRNVAEEVWRQLEQSGQVDGQKLAYECSKKGICPQDAIWTLIANKSGDVQKHAADLKTEWKRREFLQINEELRSRLLVGEDPETALAAADAQRDIIGSGAEDKNQTRVQQAMAYLDEVIKAKEGKSTLSFSTGNPEFDRMIGGIGVPGRLTIQGARPGMAKTTRALQMALTAARQGCPTLVVSQEMEFHELMNKNVQSQTGIDNADIQEGKITDSELEQINDCVAEFHDLPIYIEDEPMPWEKIKSKIRQYCKKYGVRFVVIDYLQLLKGSRSAQNRNLEVAEITRDMKLLSKAAKCHIWSLSQLSRDVEKRGGDKRPMLSDLRDSGSIEQDAGQIIFNYRPEYYEILEDAEGESLVGVLDNIVAKNRYTRRKGVVREYYDYSKDIYLPHRPEFADDPPETSYNPNISPPPKTNDGDDIPF